MNFVRLRLFFALLSTVVLVGCASPQQASNTFVGATAGAIFGAVLGDSREAAAAGALIGGLVGASVPTGQAGYHVNSGHPATGGTIAAPRRIHQPVNVRCENHSYWDGYGCRLKPGQVVVHPRQHRPGLCQNPQVMRNGRYEAPTYYPC